MIDWKLNSHDTLPGIGKQGEFDQVLTPDVPTVLFFETVEEIYSRVFREFAAKNRVAGLVNCLPQIW